MTGEVAAMTRATYHIRVSGMLPAELLTELGSLDLIVAPAETVLCGSLPHQSALFALVRRIDSLGLELVEVRWVAGGDIPGGGSAT
jgi:hypothetical protein